MDIPARIALMPRKYYMVCAAVLLTAAAVPGADAPWTRIKSRNFELVTSAGEKRGRDAILYFERVQSNPHGRALLDP